MTYTLYAIIRFSDYRKIIVRRTFPVFGSSSIAFHVSTIPGPFGSIAISGFVGWFVNIWPGGKDTGQ